MDSGPTRPVQAGMMGAGNSILDFGYKTIILHSRIANTEYAI